jgi:hypothetical protein
MSTPDRSFRKLLAGSADAQDTNRDERRTSVRSSSPAFKALALEARVVYSPRPACSSRWPRSTAGIGSTPGRKKQS